MNKMMPTTVYSGIKNTEDCVITLQTMSKRGIQYRMWLVGQHHQGFGARFFHSS